MGRIRLAFLTLVVLMAALPAVADAQVQPRIVGGYTTSTSEYPWQAAVVLAPAKASGSAFQRQVCGGSLVTRYVVLTAAHCIYNTDPDCGPYGSVPVCVALTDPGGDGTERLDANDVDVVLGVTQLSTAGPADEIQVRPGGVDYQLGYNPNTAQKDVGYLVLAEPGSDQQAIDIAASDETGVWAPGVFAETSGWGSTSPDDGNDTNGFEYTPSDVLRAASVPIVADSTCGSAAVYGDGFKPATMVCAGYLSGGVDTCFGDSGGPLEAPLEGAEYRLIGITSWGDGCAQPNAPGVYTRVAQPLLRDAIVTRVLQFESDHGIAHTEEIMAAGGGQPRSGGPKYPAPTSGSTAQPVIPTATATSPFAKCKRIKNKRKRKRCIRRVRAALGQ